MPDLCVQGKEKGISGSQLPVALPNAPHGQPEGPVEGMPLQTLIFLRDTGVASTPALPFCVLTSWPSSPTSSSEVLQGPLPQAIPGAQVLTGILSSSQCQASPACSALAWTLSVAQAFQGSGTIADLG